ncbi:hypothetical protein [Pedobacter hartonius]|uniref:Uncharacterized protein n=1 Tax=Pedobacter hartonius TaxID=425514 RepID=A0A1H4GRW7_9SPHI|nr:hypothetical protein [Pedobacter hartonius]SEB12274.1 hypothetical protein SAMN05443550_11153 [Pedobacter hartonius]
MNTKGQIKLNYPDEFRIACKISNLKHEELIQYFIDQVSFYAFIGGNMEPAHLWATTVSIECKEFWNKIPVETISDPLVQEISLKYIRKLTALSLEAGLTKNEETSTSISFMNEWSAELIPLTDYEPDITTTKGEVFNLTFDFNLVCRLHGIHTDLLLQYFVDNISLARERATNVIEEIGINPSVAVLLILVSYHDDVKHRILPHQEIYRKYGLQLLQLDKKQKSENDFESRVESYSAFYREWYNALTIDIN